jgi:ribosomal-protein-alanine N-acetyltransferase
MLPLMLREMKEEDIMDVLSIEVESFTTPWTRASFYEEIYNPLSISRVALLKGKIVGYICASIVMDEGHILNVTVHPLYRMIGIATTMIADVLAHMVNLECSKVFLEVRASNRAAIEMYRGFNFEELARRRDYYRHPREDAIVMRLIMQS